MKKNIITVTGKIANLVRMKSSTNGNPRYRFCVLTDNGAIQEVTTPVDSSYGYSITNFEDKVMTVDYQIKRNIATLLYVR